MLTGTQWIITIDSDWMCSFREAREWICDEVLWELYGSRTLLLSYGICRRRRLSEDVGGMIDDWW